jgi:hypothetical protein
MSRILLSPAPFPVQRKLRRSASKNQYSGSDRTGRLALDRSVILFLLLFASEHWIFFDMQKKITSAEIQK